jgi:hypothetical protein
MRRDDRGRDDLGRPARQMCQLQEITSGRAGSPPPALPAHSMRAAAETRMDPSGSRWEVSSPRAMSAWTQGIVRPSQRAASGRVSAARPSIRVIVATVHVADGEVKGPLHVQPYELVWRAGVGNCAPVVRSVS